MDTTPPSVLERLRHPDQPGAWGRFAELSTPLLYYWLRRRGVRQADAADLVQKLPAFEYDPRLRLRQELDGLLDWAAALFA